MDRRPGVGSGEPRRYRVLCSREAGNELVAAECRALTGGLPDPDGVATAQTLDRVPQAAYIKFGLRLLAEGKTLNALVAKLAACPLEGAEGFRLDLVRLSGEPSPSRSEAIRTVASVIPARPNLSVPSLRLLLVQQRLRWWLGRLEALPDRSYRRHDRKPFRTSSSLPSRLARALVNLLPPQARTLLDPCCGTGSILLEAAALGLEAVGLDWNPKMVRMSQKNLSHFGYTATVHQADARTWSSPADAVVTDLPYGRNLQTTQELIAAILSNCARLAPFGVFVFSEEIGRLLLRVGYRRVEVYRVPKGRSFVRYVHVGVRSPN
ncbi:MAG: methyltransferase [Candidatus Poribacteria bacterium]|nr:MAG: methyltransferase [Candidatus Poribacteria bacterium]